MLPSGRIAFDLHRLAAQVEVRLEVGDHRVFLQHGEALGVGDRVRRDVEEAALLEAGEADQVAALGRLLAFRIEPERDLRAGVDFLADGVEVLIPRQFLAGHDQLAGAFGVNRS